ERLASRRSRRATRRLSRRPLRTDDHGPSADGPVDLGQPAACSGEERPRKGCCLAAFHERFACEREGGYRTEVSITIPSGLAVRCVEYEALRAGIGTREDALRQEGQLGEIDHQLVPTKGPCSEVGV